MPESLKAVFPSIKTEPFALDLLQALERAGFKDPVLFGGAIRDHHLGLTDQIHDYDVWGNFGTTINPDKDRQTLRQRLQNYLVQNLPGVTVKSFEGEDHSKESSFVGIKVILDFKDKEISLFLNNQETSLEEKAMLGDAPINCVAMDAKGRVAAHPDFFDHISRRVYHPFGEVPPERREQRFKKFAAKISGLTIG